jgi:phospholipid/cholesterol/gamma-HCH transport system permease protein
MAVADKTQHVGSGALAERLRDSAQSSGTYAAIRTAGEIGTLGVQCVRMLLRPSFEWVPDAVVEASTSFRRCLVPLMISTGVWTVTFGTILFGLFTQNLGVSDRFAGGTNIGYMREVNTWITLMVFAGVAGGAATADIGARRIREELDALDVLGVNKLRVLVLPRVVGMTFAAVILPIIAQLTTTALNLIFVPARFHYTYATFFADLKLNIFGTDIFATFLKHGLMGGFVALVACQKGLSCERGAEGVGRAVNQTVVLSFVGIWTINSLFNLGLLSLDPSLSVARG